MLSDRVSLLENCTCDEGGNFIFCSLLRIDATKEPGPIRIREDNVCAPGCGTNHFFALHGWPGFCFYLVLFFYSFFSPSYRQDCRSRALA